MEDGGLPRAHTGLSKTTINVSQCSVAAVHSWGG